MSDSVEPLDVTQVDGPHSPERTAAAARLIADAVRFLNYATLPASNAPGISYAGDVDDVLGSIHGAAGGLQQTFGQLAECLRDDLATGRLRMARGRPNADDPAAAVEYASAGLAEAARICGGLRMALEMVRRTTAGMYLEESCAGCDERGAGIRQQPNGDLVCGECGRMVSSAAPEDVARPAASEEV